MSLIITKEQTEVLFENKEIDTIFQISDIHLRKYQFHKQYKKVFQNLYKKLESTPYPSKSIILVSGDIVHSKLEMSPELIQETREFLVQLSDITTTVVFAGNHDLEVTNQHRLDALTPIIKSVESDNLIYLKDTGTYEFGLNLRFSLTSVFDYKKVPFHNINDNRKNIYLYHGVVNDAYNDFGYQFQNNRFNLEDFDGFDYVMLGDIHKHQILQYKENEKPHVVMCGSLIQQNFGESIKGHGITKWDLTTEISNNIIEFIEVENNFKYIDIALEKDNVSNIEELIDHIDKNKDTLNIKVRNKHKTNNESAFIQLLNDNFKNIYNIRFIDDYVFELEENSIGAIENIKNLANTDYQQDLIQNYIQENDLDISELDRESIYHINEDMNEKIDKSSFNLFNTWKPLKITFDNMFCFGGSNVIDFTKLKDITGLFAKNFSGKSFIMEIILFAIFDKTIRASNTNEMINHNEDGFMLEFLFEHNSEEYLIIKKTKRVSDTYVKIDELFYKYKDGKKELIDGSSRRNVVKEISKYFTDYNTFTYTNISIQHDHFGFIGLSQTRRKQFLMDLFSLNIFKLLHKEANDIKKDLKGFVKHSDVDQLIEETKLNEENIKNCNIELDIIDIETLQSKVDIDNEKIKEYENMILKLENNIDKTVEYNSVEMVENEITSLQKSIQNLLKIQTSNLITIENILKENITLDIYEDDYINKIETKINDEIKPKLYKLNSDINDEVKNYEMKTLELHIENIKKEIEEEYEKLQSNEIDIEKINTKMNMSQLILTDELIINFNNKESYDKLTENIIKVKIKLDLLGKDYEYYKKVDNVEYDKNCKFCMSNSLVKESIENETKFKEIEQSINDLIIQMEEYSNVRDSLNFDKNEYNLYEDTIKSKTSDLILLNAMNESNNEYVNNITKLKNTLIEYEKIVKMILDNQKYSDKIKLLDIELSKYSDMQLSYYNNRKQIEDNKVKILDLKLQNKDNTIKINTLKSEINEFENVKTIVLNNSKLNVKIVELIKELESYKSEIADDNKFNLQKMITKSDKLKQSINTYKTINMSNQKQIDKIIDYEDKLNLYETYMNIINHKSGIPIHIIERLLPLIQNKVNAILELITEFTIKLFIEDDMLQIKAVYDFDNREMDISLCSGFERIITSIAFKVAFVEIANLPKFLIIDEGFSAFDSGNLNSLYTIFDLLRDKLDFVLIVTHNDNIKDMTDFMETININTYSNNGISYNQSKIEII